MLPTPSTPLDIKRARQVAWAYTQDLRLSELRRAHFFEVARRFKRHAAFLEKNTWLPFFKKAESLGAESFIGGGASALVSLVAEGAIRWGVSIEIEIRGPVKGSAEVSAAAKELLSIENEVRSCAADLRRLLLKRTELIDRHSIDTDADSLGLDLWELLDRAGQANRYEAWRWHAQSLFNLADSQSIESPDLEDVLLHLSLSPGATVVSAQSGADQASLNRKQLQNVGDLSDYRVRFFGQLDRHSWRPKSSSRRVSAFDCMTEHMMSPLLLVAYGRDPSHQSDTALTIANLRSARAEFRKTRKVDPAS